MSYKKKLKIINIYSLNLNGEIKKYNVSKFKRKKGNKKSQHNNNNKFVQNNELICDNNNNQNDFPIQENHFDIFQEIFTNFDQEEGNDLNNEDLFIIF